MVLGNYPPSLARRRADTAESILPTGLLVALCQRALFLQNLPDSGWRDWNFDVGDAQMRQSVRNCIGDGWRGAYRCRFPNIIFGRAGADNSAWIKAARVSTFSIPSPVSFLLIICSFLLIVLMVVPFC